MRRGVLLPRLDRIAQMLVKNIVVFTKARLEGVCEQILKSRVTPGAFTKRSPTLRRGCSQSPTLPQSSHVPTYMPHPRDSTHSPRVYLSRPPPDSNSGIDNYSGYKSAGQRAS